MASTRQGSSSPAAVNRPHATVINTVTPVNTSIAFGPLKRGFLTWQIMKRASGDVGDISVGGKVEIACMAGECPTPGASCLSHCHYDETSIISMILEKEQH